MAGLTEQAVVRQLYRQAFGIRILFGLGAWLAASTLGINLIEDAAGYSRQAADLASSWLSGTQPDWFLDAMNSGYDAWFMIGLLACFYCLTGGFEAVPFAICAQCLLTAYTPVLAYRAGRRLGLPADGARFAGRLIAYSPAFVFWAGALYKEGVILLALFLMVDHVLRLQQEFRPASAVILGLSLIVMFGLRFYVGAILSITILISLAFGRRGRNTSPGFAAVRQILVLLFFLSVFSLFGLGEQVERVTGGRLEEKLEKINTSRKDLATSTSGFLPDADVSTSDKALSFLPVGLAYFLTVPLPWHFGSMRQNLTIAETMIWIAVIYPLAYRGTVRGLRANPSGVLFLVLSAVAISCFYALFIGNIGTVYRLRVQVWALLALLAGWGYAKFRPALPHATHLKVVSGISHSRPDAIHASASRQIIGAAPVLSLDSPNSSEREENVTF